MNAGHPDLRRKTPLNIAYLLTTHLDGPLGSGRIGPLAQALARRGHNVEIFALHPDFASVDPAPFLLNGVKVQYVAPMHVRKTGSQKTYYGPVELVKVTANATWRLLRAASRSRAAIIHVCKPHPMNGIAGLGCAGLQRKRLFVDCDDYEAAANAFGAGWQKKIVAGFERRIPGLAAAVTTNTHFMLEMLAGWGVEPGKIVYLPNGVDRTRFQAPAPEKVHELRLRLGLDGRQVVAYVGSLSLKSHPVNLLLEAYQQARQALQRPSLLIVGGGEDYERIRTAVAQSGFADEAVLCGQVPPDEIAAYYHLAQVSIDPVYDDEVARGRSPLKMFESWACGVPFITADVGDRRWLLGSPPAGVLIPPGSPAALSDAILQVLQDPTLSDELRQRGLNRVQAYFWDQLAVDMEKIYQKYADNS